MIKPLNKDTVTIKYRDRIKYVKREQILRDIRDEIIFRDKYQEYMRNNSLDYDIRQEKLGKFKDPELRDILDQYTYRCML